jgi:NAD+--asparagine ADP-ribosyltransferase
MPSDEKFEKFVSLAAKDAEKASEIVAKAFYKILRKNGFSNEQVISVAGDILECLCNTYEGYSSKPKGKSKKSGVKNPDEG